MGKKNKMNFEDNLIVDEQPEIIDSHNHVYNDIDLKITAFQMAMDVPSASGDDNPAGIRELLAIARDIYNFLTSNDNNIKK